MREIVTKLLQNKETNADLNTNTNNTPPKIIGILLSL